MVTFKNKADADLDGGFFVYTCGNICTLKFPQNIESVCKGDVFTKNFFHYSTVGEIDKFPFEIELSKNCENGYALFHLKNYDELDLRRAYLLSDMKQDGCIFCLPNREYVIAKKNGIYYSLVNNPNAKFWCHIGDEFALSEYYADKGEIFERYVKVLMELKRVEKLKDMIWERWRHEIVRECQYGLHVNGVFPKVQTKTVYDYSNSPLWVETNKRLKDIENKAKSLINSFNKTFFVDENGEELPIVAPIVKTSEFIKL